MAAHDQTAAATFVQRILCAKDRAQAQQALGEATFALGFDGYCLGTSAPIGDNWALAPLLTNWPPADLAEYAARRFYEIDPTLPHLRRFHTPYFWDARRPPSPQVAPFFDFLRRTPVRSGVVVPIGMKSERLWVLSASRSDFEAFDPAALDLLPLYGHAAKSTLVDDRSSDTQPHPLSAQQLAFLRLAAEGKSSTDIAAITGYSRRAVDYHFTEILRKLNVSTRAQAVMDLPLLDPDIRSRMAPIGKPDI